MNTENLDPSLMLEMLAGREGKKPIGEEEISYANTTLQKYKEGKQNLEARIVEDEKWYKLRHWDAIRKKSSAPQPEPSSAWLFNSILNKHADAMDNYPEPVVLPREAGDKASADTLSAILPVVMEYNDFESVYYKNWWEKLKHGTAAYGIFWNPKLDNGLGDIEITSIDLLNLFWEPGIADIEDSKNLFITTLVSNADLESQYPQLKGELKGNTIDLAQYSYDDNVDTSDKSLVVDWYYKRNTINGKTVLHYVKFVGNTLLFASENEPEYAETGWYEDGEYPVVLDTLYPEKGTPIGFGYVAICKDPQLYIDKLSANILENSMMATKKRFFKGKNSNVNEKQFLDWNVPLVDVEGSMDETHLKEITVRPLDPVYVNVLQMKQEELKETSANRDVNSGGAGGGVTAAAAIAALQEAGNKVSRDMISASYRAHVAISSKTIERMRQFYNLERSFRITGEKPGSYDFIGFNNADIKEQALGLNEAGYEMYRKPIFDIKIKAQKRNPFSKVAQNETAKELYSMGFFNPERAQETMGALNMMDFEGIDEVKDYVSKGATLMSMVQQMQQQIAQMGLVLQQVGVVGVPGVPNNPNADIPAPAQQGFNSSANGEVVQAQTPMTNYGEALAKRSVPDMGA